MTNTNQADLIGNLSAASTEDLRALFAAIRSRAVNSGEGEAPTVDAFMAELRERIGRREPTPQDWVAAALSYRIPCGRCASTGQFITRLENGQPKGPGGICYRCQGKGFQVDSDRRRNWGHDVHQRVA